MNYRQLQQALKTLRNEGKVAATFKLNQKKAILEQEYDRVTATAAPENELTFGVEIEIARFKKDGGCYWHEDIETALTEAGVTAVQAYRYDRKDIPAGAWVIEGEHCGSEIVSPILKGSDGLKTLKRVMSALKKAGFTTNRSCGMHVHVGAEGFSVEQIKAIVAGYSANERHIDRVMNVSRTGDRNDFCKSVTREFALGGLSEATTIEEVIDLQSSRYCKVNLQAYRLHGTVEFRQHQGCLDSKRAAAWVEWLLSFCQNAERHIADNGFDALFANNITHFARVARRAA